MSKYSCRHGTLFGSSKHFFIGWCPQRAARWEEIAAAGNISPQNSSFLRKQESTGFADQKGLKSGEKGGF